MSNIKSLLDQMTNEVQTQVKTALSGILTGGIVQGYLPQAWVFETETEVVTFHVDNNGNVRTSSGASRQPDVLIQAPHSDLSMALSTHRLPPGAQKRVRVVHHTQKGRTAWNFLGKRFGF